ISRLAVSSQIRSVESAMPPDKAVAKMSLMTEFPENIDAAGAKVRSRRRPRAFEGRNLTPKPEKLAMARVKEWGAVTGQQRRVEV
ncbi:hypothetical protein U1Q18_033521, partial [Sarracenia purpurea var. burkii]